LTLDGKRLATSTIRSPESWLAAIGEKAGGEMPREELSARDQAVEYLMMSLRLAEGCDTSRIEALAPYLLSKEGEDRLLALGLLSRLGTTLKATPSGRLVLNRLFLELTT
jgi:oxygen-independent coproporphyrinogen-3 oxidase